MNHGSRGKLTFNRVAGALLLCAAASGPLVATAAPPAIDGCGSIAAQETIRDEIIVPLFDALRAGRIQDIRRYLSPEMAHEYERLFSQNPTYGDFLRDHYEGSAFEVLDVSKDGDHYDATVLVYWTDGRSMEVPLQLGGSAASITGVLASAPCR